MSSERREWTTNDAIDALPKRTLKALRVMRGHNQEALGNILGLPASRISEIERRMLTTNPRFKKVKSYVEALGGQLKLIVEFPDEPLVELKGIIEDDEDC